ncbi:hypothetical protein BXZ70DRAFT_1013369 [Cristinia sonorae]|uniref:Uncharacterized protein n=1 Tax=Cristinia sonorae TaxID=1940300 RepID=A0A8K0UCN8_9AGAR|nr:hypothetical protein BXZ70DRAFT_1013369 [Cristinia sonorae]
MDGLGNEERDPEDFHDLLTLNAPPSVAAEHMFAVCRSWRSSVTMSATNMRLSSGNCNSQRCRCYRATPCCLGNLDYPDTFLPEEIHRAAKSTCAWLAQRAQGDPLVGVDACRFLLAVGLLLRDMKVVAMTAEERATQMPGILVPQYVVESAFPLALMRQVIHKALLQVRLLATPHSNPHVLEDDAGLSVHFVKQMPIGVVLFMRY